ncbi:hypothetical protein J4Q44_G00263770 [Coregonus suidteri]|uniref:EF-hand domain-containing protein n=1 Tax=Coregonus suidteri TaxID=861788 RepID=A0AAN8L7C9_9TELE
MSPWLCPALLPTPGSGSIDFEEFLGHDGEAPKGGPGRQVRGRIIRGLPYIRQLRPLNRNPWSSPPYWHVTEISHPGFTIRNGDGFIDREELNDILAATGEPVTEEECTELMTDADLNKDNRLDFDEFLKMMENVQ